MTNDLLQCCVALLCMICLALFSLAEWYLIFFFVPIFVALYGLTREESDYEGSK